MADTDFITRIEKLVDIEKAAILKAMEKIDVDGLYKLLDAVEDEDAKAVADLLGVEAPPEKAIEESYSPYVGEEVHCDGKPATVKIPNGPRDTIGVIMDGRLRMVERHRVTPLQESMLSPVDTIVRMQQLAGINVPGEETVDIVIDKAPVSVNRVEPIEIEDRTLEMGEVMAAFDHIARAIPDLKIRDARLVRDRLNKLMGQLNESRTR